MNFIMDLPTTPKITDSQRIQVYVKTGVDPAGRMAATFFAYAIERRLAELSLLSAPGGGFSHKDCIHAIFYTPDPTVALPIILAEITNMGYGNLCAIGTYDEQAGVFRTWRTAWPYKSFEMLIQETNPYWGKPLES
jgi:hypothetical protein